MPGGLCKNCELEYADVHNKKKGNINDSSRSKKGTRRERRKEQGNGNHEHKRESPTR